MSSFEKNGDENSGFQVQQRRIKRNGFFCPFHPFQIISYVVVGLDLYAYFFIDMVIISNRMAISIVLALIYAGFYIAMVVLAVQATKIDPTDPVIYLQR